MTEQQSKEMGEDIKLMNTIEYKMDEIVEDLGNMTVRELKALVKKTRRFLAELNKEANRYENYN